MALINKNSTPKLGNKNGIISARKEGEAVILETLAGVSPDNLRETLAKARLEELEEVKNSK